MSFTYVYTRRYGHVFCCRYASLTHKRFRNQCRMLMFVCMCMYARMHVYTCLRDAIIYRFLLIPRLYKANQANRIKACHAGVQTSDCIQGKKIRNHIAAYKRIPNRYAIERNQYDVLTHKPYHILTHDPFHIHTQNPLQWSKSNGPN